MALRELVDSANDARKSVTVVVVEQNAAARDDERRPQLDVAGDGLVQMCGIASPACAVRRCTP